MLAIGIFTLSTFLSYPSLAPNIPYLVLYPPIRLNLPLGVLKEYTSRIVRLINLNDIPQALASGEGEAVATAPKSRAPGRVYSYSVQDSSDP